MDVFFTSPEDMPVPPDEVRIQKLEARAWPDGKRAAVRFSLTPFQTRPNVELKIHDEEGTLAAELSVVEVLQNEMEFTLHLRGEVSPGIYSVQMKVFYTDLEGYQQDSNDENAAGEILQNSSNIVDRGSTSFEIEVS